MAGGAINVGSRIEENVLVGTRIQGAHIGRNSFIEAGNGVVHDVPEGIKAFGVPARMVSCKMKSDI